MSMSSSVEAIRPPDETWRKMRAAYDACKVIDARIPENVDAFFNGEPPDATGVVVERVSQYSKTLPEWVTKVDNDMEDGFEIDVTKLPKDVTVVRFTISY